MAKRHFAGDDLLSQIRRCQELLLARSGVDEFYETLRLLIAKTFHERSSSREQLTYSVAQNILIEHASDVETFVDGGAILTAPVEVVNDCFNVLAATKITKLGFEALDAVFEGMTARDSKADKGQFFTPRHVIKFCINVLRPTIDDLVCDPACGSAAFLQAADEYIGGNKNANNLFGFDISRRASKTANLMSFLACGSRLSIHQLDSLDLDIDRVITPKDQTIEKVLSAKKKNFNGFNIIATNPPFAGDVGAAEYSNRYELGRCTKGRVERDVLFLERCTSLLSPKGRLAIVLPDNKISASKFTHIRRWLLKNMRIKAIVSLHPYTFRPYTSQKAIILFAEKPTGNNESPYEIALFRSDLAGKTSSGQIVMKDGKINHDLDEIEQELIALWKI